MPPAPQPAGHVNWKQLLKDIAEELGLDVDKESDLVGLAQFHLTNRGSRSGLARREVAANPTGQKAPPSRHGTTWGGRRITRAAR